MRVNVYAEEMTERIEIISKEIDGATFTGLRLYLELPATVNGEQYQGPFMHRPGDDDSSAVTFWGKRDLRAVLRKMLAKLDEHYAAVDPTPAPPPDRTQTQAVEPQFCGWCGEPLGAFYWNRRLDGPLSCGARECERNARQEEREEVDERRERAERDGYERY